MLALASFTTFAQDRTTNDKTAAGQGVIKYEDGLFKSTPDENERAAALGKAKSNAILAYAANLNEATRTLFEAKRAQLLSNPDRYVISYKVVSEDINKDALSFTVVIEAVIDEAKIRNDIGDSFGSANATLAKNNVAVFFIAREVASTTVFDDKATKVTNLQNERSGATSSSSDGSGVSATESSSATSVVTAGGSTVKKSDVQEYRIDEVSRGEFGGYLMDAFSAKGMNNIMDGNFFESVTYFQEDYGKGQSIKPTTWRKAMKELKDPENEISYIVVGTVDMSAKGVHEQSGQPIVHTTIIASIYDIKGRIPKVVTTLRPITNKGMGQDQSLAKKAALDRTAKSAVSEIIDKLRVKGLL